MNSLTLFKKAVMFSSLKADKNQLGVYWGKDAFYFVESIKGQPDKTAYVRFNTPVPGDTGQKIPEGLRLTSLIQQTIKEKKFVSKKVNLSLSAKDVIYRSFVIPFMQPNEVKNVVDFEATKYIPIKLEDLSYTYHAVPFNEGEQKNLRILFVATRKIVLERYVSLLQQAGLETEFIEPSSVSLLRTLQKYGHAQKQQSIAVIEVENDGGKIMVADKEIVQFVREFQSTIQGPGTPEETAKFLNDVRVSFNFYQRQNLQGKLDRIILLSSQELPNLNSALSQEFKVPVTALTVGKITKTDIADVGILSANGVAGRERIPSSKNFDLVIKSARTAKGALEPTGFLADWDIKNLAISLGISAAIFYGFTSLGNFDTSQSKKKEAELKAKLGIYESSTKEKLTELRDLAINRLNQYKDVRTKSEVAYFLYKIPSLFPSGAWISNLTIEYAENTENREGSPRRTSKVSVVIEGYVYLPNTNDQIRMANTLASKMKDDKDLAKVFNEVILTNVRQDTLNNDPVTNFRINLK